MSAWSIGSATAVRRPDLAGYRTEATDQATTDDPPTVDTLIAWIPGEVIAAYTALVLALQPEDAEGMVTEITSGWWLIGAIAFAAALTFASGFSKSDDLTGRQWGELSARTVLSAIAFALWSLVVPGSWWQSIDDIADNTTVVALVAGIVAALFGLIAQGIVRRLD